MPEYEIEPAFPFFDETLKVADPGKALDLGLDVLVFEGTGGDDRISGHDDGMRIAAGAGDDTLDGQAGFDRLAGGDGHDSIFGGKAADRIAGGLGADEVYAGADGDRPTPVRHHTGAPFRISR